MLFGIGLLGYALSIVAASLVDSKTKETQGMSSFSFKSHSVIVNYPNISKLFQLIKEFIIDPAFSAHRQIVLVDKDLEELPVKLIKRNIHYVRGNPEINETLYMSSIGTASHALVLSKK
jgi:voltage-gated potassium channel